MEVLSAPQWKEKQPNQMTVVSLSLKNKITGHGGRGAISGKTIRQQDAMGKKSFRKLYRYSLESTGDY